MSKMTAAYT